jgi:hypothetical protein
MHLRTMPSGGKTSAFHPGPRSDLESHGFAPEFVPTAAEKRLMLFMHIIRAFGITLALMINAIIFVPFFVFGILPVLIKERFGKISTSVYSPLALTSPNGKTERLRGIFFSRDHHRIKSTNGDVSPLLLSADTSISDFAPYGDRPIIFPPSVLGSCATYDGPTARVPQPHIPGCGYTYNGNSEACAQPDSTSEDTSEDEGLMMKKTHWVDLLKGTPRYGGGLASGLKVPGHGQDISGNTVMKREKTWENLQEAVYPTSKLL